MPDQTLTEQEVTLLLNLLWKRFQYEKKRKVPPGAEVAMAIKLRAMRRLIRKLDRMKADESNTSGTDD